MGIECLPESKVTELADNISRYILSEVGIDVIESPTKTIGNAIDHPPHYTAGSIEPIDVIEDWQLGFCLGNAVKYIARCEHKGSKLEDLKKAAWYLSREIARTEA